MSPRSSLAALLLVAAPAFAADPPEPKFRAVTIDDRIQIGYGLAIADVDGDKHQDILLADKKQFVWYRNPGKTTDAAAKWDKFILVENLTEKDNVCIAAHDLDGDGKCEVAVGAEWNPGDTVNSGAVFYLIPPADRTQRWEPVKFPSVEPTTHRMRWMKLDEKQWGLVVVPLHGRGNKNGEGAPVKVLCYVKPADPRAEWKAEVVDESMHMTHNFTGHSGDSVFVGGKEGAIQFVRKNKHWEPTIGVGTRGWGDNSRGLGEVSICSLGVSFSVLAAVEPMHGNELVVYAFVGYPAPRRLVLTDTLADGHALACGDVLGIGNDQIVVGWRGNPQQPRPVGIKLFTSLDYVLPFEKDRDWFGPPTKWRESLIDDNEMACEDLRLADLNGDQKLDIVAAGRATKNVKIYFNETPR